jgi:hypothetical protein
MDPKLTTILAIYAAFLSTAGFAWQVFQWMRNHPKIAVSAEADSNGMDEWIRFELRNRGGKATTIEEIMFVTYANAFTRFLKFPARVEYLSSYHNDTIKLPIMLQPGELWKGNCPLVPDRESLEPRTSRKERLDAGRLNFRVRCAHTDRLISGVVRREGFFPRM